MKKEPYHRTRLDILLAILKFIGNEGHAKKTHILYATNLNTRSLEKFLGYLIDINAVEVVENNGTKYALTPRGRRMLTLMMKLKSFFESPTPKELHNNRVVSRLSSTLKTLANDVFQRIERKKLRGYSGIEYYVDTVVGLNSEYIILMLDDTTDHFFIADLACKAIMYMLDTDYKCIILSSNSLNNSSSLDIMRTLFEKAGIDSSRYFFAAIK